MGNYKSTKKHYIEYDKKCNKSFSYDENYYKERYDDKYCGNKYKDDYCYEDKYTKDIYCDDYYCKDKYPDDKCCDKKDHCCKDEYPNDKDCNDDKKYKKSNSFPSDCCTETIRQALEIIREAVRSLGNSSTLDVVIYTTDGSSETITFTSRGRSVKITDDAIIYNCVAIALNSISKIEILTSSLSENFRNRLLNRLNRLSESCENPYLAYDLDDESYCPRCKKEKCNCKCENTLGDYVINNVDELSGVGRIGGGRPIFGISEVNTTLVVSDVEAILTTTPVLQSADLDTSFTNVISDLSTISTSVVNSISTNNQQVVREIQQTPARAITASSVDSVVVVGSVAPFTTLVVQNINPNNNSISVVNSYSTTQVVKNITKSSAVATNIVDFDTTPLVNEITTSEVQVVQSINEFSANVINSVTATTSPAVSRVSYDTKRVVNSITPVTDTIITTSDPSFADAITDIDTTTVSVYQDISRSTNEAVTEVGYTTRNVVNDITTSSMEMIDSLAVFPGEAVGDIDFTSIPLVNDVDSTTTLVVSGVTFDATDVLLHSENHFAVNNVLNSIDADTNIQIPRSASVGNCLGEGPLEVVADNVPVSIVNFTTNLTNRLNDMIKDINNILKKCCCDHKDDHDCYDKCDCKKDICDKYNCYDDEERYRDRCKDKKHRCPSIPYFKVSDLLEEVYIDLNADVTINGEPVVSSCVDISVFDDSTANYLHNVDETYLADGVLAGFSEDEHGNVLGDLNVSFVTAVDSVTYTTENAVNSITFANTNVVNDVDFSTLVVNQFVGFTTTQVVRDITPRTSNFVNSVSLVRPVEVVSSITTFADEFVSNFDTDETNVVTGVNFGTTLVVSSVNSSTAAYVNGVSTTSQAVLRDITTTPVTVAQDVFYDTEDGVTELQTRNQTFLTDVTTSNVSVVSNLSLGSADVVNNIEISRREVVYDVNPRSTTVTRLNNASLATVAANLVPVTQTITTINTISNGSVASVSTISTVDVISAVEFDDEDTIDAVTNVELDIDTVTVVQSLDGEDINVLGGNTREAIAPVSASAGNGLLIVEEPDGDISIYSLCKVQSVEIDSDECE